MTIDELIEKLNMLKEKIGGDKEIPLVTTYTMENDVYSLEYPVVGEFDDCSGNEYKCGFIIGMKSDEFTRKGIPHYKWNPADDIIKQENHNG